MMRGAIMTSDALVASLIVVLIIVVWAQAHSLVVGTEIAEAKIGAKTMRVLALADWSARELAEGRTPAHFERFGVEGAQMRWWKIGEGKPGEGTGSAERICIRRLVSPAKEAEILEVCA